MKMIPAGVFAAWCMSAFFGAHAQPLQNPQATEPITLSEAIVLSLNAAPGLRAHGATVQASKAGIRQARVRPNPELGLEVENFAGSGRLNGFDSTEFTFSASQKIERGGKRRARVTLAGRDVELARQEQAIARLDMIHAVQRAYIEAASANAAFTNAVERAKTASEIEAVARRRVESAKDPATALHRAAAQALQAGVDVEQAEQASTLAAQQLAALWNAAGPANPIDSSILFVLDADTDATQIEGPVPDLALFEAAEARAEAAAALARAQSSPDPTIGLGVRYLRDEDDVAGILSFSMPIPVFNANRGNIERANAERLSAEWAALEARRRLERARIAQHGALTAARKEALAVKQELIPAAARTLESAREGFERGAFTYLDVLDAQSLVSDLRDRELDSLKRFHFARIALDRLSARYIEPFPGEEIQP